MFFEDDRDAYEYYEDFCDEDSPSSILQPTKKRECPKCGIMTEMTSDQACCTPCESSWPCPIQAAERAMGA